MRIPIWPGVRLSVWERQDPEALRVVMPLHHGPLSVRRVLSKRGWVLLRVRYDWCDHGTLPVQDPARNPVVPALTSELHRRVTHLATIRGASVEAVSDEIWVQVSGEVIGLRGALGIALGGTVKGGTADQLAQAHYRAWAMSKSSEWSRCQCERCAEVLAGGGR